MRRRGKRSWTRCLGQVALAAVVLASSGCLAAAVGIVAVGAAGGAAGYAYSNGSVSRLFHATYEQTYAAVLSALQDLKMPPRGAYLPEGGIVLENSTDTGENMEISLERAAEPFPADGPVTVVSVRVGVFGDSVISERILAQVETRLAQPAPGPPSVPLNTPLQTAPPPLAEPAKQ